MTRLVLFLMLFCGPALARDDGRYTSSPLKEWFDRLASRKGLCCSVADGYVVDDPDWESNGGHYRVRIEDEWLMFRTMPLSPCPTNSAGRWCGQCGTVKA